MTIETRVLRFITRTNWVIFILVTGIGAVTLPTDYAVGVFSGGLLATVNFHLLSRTLRKTLALPHSASHTSVLAKYYIRFMISGLILFILIKWHYVHPVGLVVGLSVVVASIMLATVCEITHLFVKEAM